MNTPNKITFARIILAAMMIAFLIVASFIPDFHPWVGREEYGVSLVYVIVCVIFVLASVTDLVDGQIARKTNQITDLGKFLDPVADKLLIDSSLIFLAIPLSFAPGNALIPWFVVVLMILRDLVVDALRFVAASKGRVLAANVFGKIKTISQMIAIPFVLVNGWPFVYFDASWGYGRICLVFIYIACFFSLLSGIIYVYKNRDVLKG
ncbi:MAG: CDP-diacylglycerol--glycerol-3-phosphate 3-phosphatidyltransferase [Bacilli bacterium]|nr:CDP-diacylglycerol--glycerol-3-phosphate 3-phosphatidyltransferase [Bacilli bacterium]